jgi:hypothetical protein
MEAPSASVPEEQARDFRSLAHMVARTGKLSDIGEIWHAVASFASRSPCRDLLDEDALDHGNAYGSTFLTAAGRWLARQVSIVKCR